MRVPEPVGRFAETDDESATRGEPTLLRGCSLGAAAARIQHSASIARPTVTRQPGARMIRLGFPNSQLSNRLNRTPTTSLKEIFARHPGLLMFHRQF